MNLNGLKNLKQLNNMLQNYKLENGVPLTDDIFTEWVWHQDTTTLADFHEANTYKLSDLLSRHKLPGEDEKGVKLLCDINFLLDVSSSIGKSFDDLFQKFDSQPGDYILYSFEQFVFLVRDNVAYQIGGGGGSECEMDTLTGFYDDDLPESVVDYAKDYPILVI